MPREGEPLHKLGFLTIGRFDPADPGNGHENCCKPSNSPNNSGSTACGFDTGTYSSASPPPSRYWLRQASVLSRIELGTAVIPLGLENPLRLAEDLSTVDLLSGGRLNPGVSVGPPMRYEDFKHKLYPETHAQENFSKDRVIRLLDNIRGVPVSDFEGTVGIEQYSRIVQPHSPGLIDRIWYGGMMSSAIWAGQQVLNYLTSSVVNTEGTSSIDFASIQGEHIDAYRAHHPNPDKARVSQGLVVIPTDSATPDQRREYRDYADARFDRTLSPQGPRGMASPLTSSGPQRR